jgi:hypothetical protein
MPLIPISVDACAFSESGLARLIQAINQNFKNLGQGGASGSVVRFTLQSQLSNNGNASGDVNTWDGSGYSMSRSGVIFDEDGIWEGEVGDEGWATARGNSDGEYSIIFMSLSSGGNLNNAWANLLAQLLNNTAGHALATLSGDLTGSTPVTISGFDWKGELPLQGAAPTEASNPYGHYGLSGDQVLLLYNAENSQWVIADVDKHEISPLTSISFNGTHLQQTSVTVAVERGSSSSTTSNVAATTTTCPP